MRKKLVFLVYGITVVLFVSLIFYTVNYFPNIKEGKDNILVEVNSINKSGKKKLPFITYIPNDKTNLLEPTLLDISSKGDIYMNIINSLIDNSKGYFKGECNLISANKTGSLVKLKFDSGFKSELSQDEERLNLEIMSMVNTLSEITGVESIEIYSGKEKLRLKGSDRFERNQEVVNIEGFKSPETALRNQMKYEQKGEFLSAYLIMSYKHSSNKKMYYDYIKEMEEIRDLGFLNGDFKIKECNIKGDKANLKVEFQNVSIEGEKVNTSIVDVKCIKLNGIWFVNWI